VTRSFASRQRRRYRRERTRCRKPMLHRASRNVAVTSDHDALLRLTFVKECARSEQLHVQRLSNRSG
jgi:hypothetical protein